jgi:pheromone a factor receptor
VTVPLTPWSSALALRYFIAKRLQFNAVLKSTQSGLTNGRFLRLLCLAFLEGSLSLAGSLVNIAISLRALGGLQPVHSWKDMHMDYGLYSQLLQGVHPNMENYLVIAYEVPLYSLIFFGLFGFGDESIKEYLAVCRAAGRIFGKAFGKK